MPVAHGGRAGRLPAMRRRRDDGTGRQGRRQAMQDRAEAADAVRRHAASAKRALQDKQAAGAGQTGGGQSGQAAVRGPT